MRMHESLVQHDRHWRCLSILPVVTSPAINQVCGGTGEDKWDGDSRIHRALKQPRATKAVLVRKKDKSWRFFVNYRRLNDITHKYDYISSGFGLAIGSHYWARPVAVQSHVLWPLPHTHNLRIPDRENPRWLSSEVSYLVDDLLSQA